MKGIERLEDKQKKGVEEFEKEFDKEMGIYQMIAIFFLLIIMFVLYIMGTNGESPINYKDDVTTYIEEK